MMDKIGHKEAINIVEYSESDETIFTDEELQILRTEFKGKLGVIPTFTGQHILKALEYVGVVILPHHIIKIRPKVSNTNFMSMIMYALKLPELRTEDFPALIHNDFYHILIRFLLHEIDSLLERGLYKGYITKLDNLTCVRGKILFKQHLLHNQNRNDKVYCSYSEVTIDTIENRILRFTLFYLSQYYFLDDNTKIEIIEYYRKFDKIALLRSISLDIFESIRYTPLNDHYRTAMNLCELILRDSSLDIERDGEKNSLSFLINMEDLFQKFVANLLAIKFGEEKVFLQKTEYIDIGRKLRVTPDIQILSNNKVVAILDTKYKEIGNSYPPSEHSVQVHSYSVSRTNKCVLIYASTKSIGKMEYPLTGGINLFTLHFNLVSSSKEEFDQNCCNFIKEVISIIQN